MQQSIYDIREISTRLDGKSGNPVYLIYDHGIPIIMKVFLKERERSYEVKSYEFLSSHSNVIIKIPKVLSLQQCDKYYMFLEYISGTTISNAIRRYSYDEEILFIIGNKLGHILRYIHNISSVECSGRKELTHMIRFTKIQSDIRDRFLLNPGRFTYVHGDPSLDNFIINDDLEITIIDVGSVIKNSYNDEPRGFPACDYNRFVIVAQLIGKREKVHNIQILINGFKDGYGSTDDIFTDEANVLFYTYWNHTLRKYLNNST